MGRTLGDIAWNGESVRLGSFLLWREDVASSAFGTQLIPRGNEEVRDAYGVLPVGW